MAVPVITSLSGFTLYTSELQTLDITATADTVGFRIYHQARIFYSGNGRTEIFRSEYHTRNGQVTVYDVADIIEKFMLQQNESVAEFFLWVSDGTDTLERQLICVYCKQRLLQPAAADLLADHFLTTHTNRLVPTNAEIRLPFYVEDGTAGGYATVGTTYTITYKTPDGSTAHATHTNYSRYGYGVQTLVCTMQTLRTLFAYDIPSDADIVSVVIKTGNRKCRVYFSTQTDLHKFIFRNAFNCLDFAWLATTRLVKTETKSSIAVICAYKSQYDVQHTRTYEDTTPVLTNDECTWLTEMLTSPYIAVEDDGNEEQILINEYKSETTDEPGNGSQINFKWQYATVRYMLGKDEFDRIFTNPYQNQFE